MIRFSGNLFLQRAFFHLFARYDLTGAVLSMLIMFAVTILIKINPELSIGQILDKMGNNPVRLAIASFGCLLLGAFFVYHKHPLSMEKYMPYFQARIFSQGQLWGKYPPELVPWLLIPNFFSVYSVETGRVISEYWLGFALMMTPFMRIGIPWIFNPYLLFSIPWIIWLSLGKGRVKNISILFLGYLPVSLLLGFGWVWLKIFIVKDGATAVANQLAGVTNSVQSQMQPNHILSSNMISTLFQKAIYIIQNVFKFPDFYFLWVRLVGLLKICTWAVPGLAILALLGSRYLRGNRHLQLWGWSAICTFAGYMFVPFSQGHGWGFRYFHSGWVVLPLLSTAFLISETCKNSSWKQFVKVIALLSLVLSTGLRFYQVHEFIGQHLSQLPELEKGNKYVCILNTERGYYVNDLIQNDPFLYDPVIILRSLNDKKDHKMMTAMFPTARRVFKSESASNWEIQENKQEGSSP